MIPIISKAWVDAQTWMVRAHCQHYDDDLFFPARGESCEAAKEICRGCPVQRECLDWAVENREYHGVWGGTSPRERRALWQDNGDDADERRERAVELHDRGWTYRQIAPLIGVSYRTVGRYVRHQRTVEEQAS